jgi:DNA-binding CsgD family transcriptional regulator
MIDEVNKKIIDLPRLRPRHVIAGFPAVLENEFFTETVGHSLGLVRFTMAWAFLLMAIFGFINKGILPLDSDTPWLALFNVIRIAIICPYILFCVISTYIKKLHRLVHPLLCLCAVLVATGVSGRIAFSAQTDPAYSFYYVGLIIVCIALYTGVQMRFIYAAPVGLVIIGIYLFAALGFNHLFDTHLGISVFTNNIFFLVSAEVMLALACFFIEYYRRNAFLLRRKIRFEEELNRFKAIENWKEAYWLHREIDAELLRHDLVNTPERGKAEGQAAGEVIRRLKIRQAASGVANLIRSIGTGVGSNELIGRIMDMALEMAGARRGCLIIRNGPGGDLEFVIRRDLDRSATSLALSVAYDALTSGATIAWNDTPELSQFPHRRMAVECRVQSLLCFPVNENGEAIGACYLDSDVTGSLFSEETSDMLVFFITQAVLSLKDAAWRGEYRKMVLDETQFRAACKKYDFTDREKELLLLILKGFSNKAISDKTLISMNTLRTHLKSINFKAGVASREELIYLFAKHAIE